MFQIFNETSNVITYQLPSFSMKNFPIMWNYVMNRKEDFKIRDYMVTGRNFDHVYASLCEVTDSIKRRSEYIFNLKNVEEVSMVLNSTQPFRQHEGFETLVIIKEKILRILVES